MLSVRKSVGFVMRNSRRRVVRSRSDYAHDPARSAAGR